MRPVLALAVLAACTPESEPPVTATGGTSTLDTQDSAPIVDGYREIGTFAFGAQFGYDADSDSLVAVTIDGQYLPPTFEIYLGEPGWNADPNLTDMYCTVAISLDGAVGTTWAQNDPLYWRGFDTTGPGGTDCDDLDPAVFGTDVVQSFAALDLGVAIGPRSADLDDWLLPQIPAEDAELYYGGLLKVTDVVGEDISLAYGTAYEVDPSFHVVFDQTNTATAVPTSTLEAPGTGTAWYVVNSATYFTL